MKYINVLTFSLLFFSSVFMGDARAMLNSAGVPVLVDLIQNRYGITIVNKSDEHSEVVLRALIVLLENAFSPKELKAMGHIRYLYAYQSHDNRFNIAAFHPEEDAISIGGKLTYAEDQEKGDSDQGLMIMSALAHELGHAFLMKRVSAQALMQLASQLGGWSFPNSRLNPASQLVFDEGLNAGYLFSKHPMQKLIRVSLNTEMWRDLNMSSAYGAENVHEWFAEAFTAFVLMRLGKKGILGRHWKMKLINLPRQKNDFWVNYNNITPELEDWFYSRLNLVR